MATKRSARRARFSAWWFEMNQMTTPDANTSTSESRPKATSASDAAAMPRPIVTTTSMRFQAIVAYCSLRPCASSASCPGTSIPVIVIALRRIGSGTGPQTPKSADPPYSPMRTSLYS